MEPTVTTVSTTVVVTVWMILLVTDRLVTVKGDANRDIPTRSATKVCTKKLSSVYRENIFLFLFIPLNRQTI